MKRAALTVVMAVFMSCGPQGEAGRPQAVSLPGERNDALTAAAASSNVPVEVLMLAAWRQTRFELKEREATAADALEVTDPQAAADDALADDVAAPEDALAPPTDTEEEAGLPVPADQDEQLGVPPEDAPRFGLFALATQEVSLESDSKTVADRLADAAKARDVTGLNLEGWTQVVLDVLYPEADDEVRAEVSRELEDAWLDGFDVTTADGERVALIGAGREFAVAQQALVPGHYPNVTVIPASSRNFGSRMGAGVRYVVIHDIEGTQAGAIAVFRNPSAQASAHYVVRASDGRIVKMVPEHFAAWHAGHAWFNHHSIGIEHEGFAHRPRGGGFYTDRQYQASANLVCAIAKRYHIPIDRRHIFGHGNVPSNLASHTLCSDAAANAGTCGGFGHHSDPGRFWNWTSYMGRIRRCVAAIH